MKHTYKVTGMTCGGCKASVEKYLLELNDVTKAIVDLEQGEVEIFMNAHISIEILQKTLPEKYTITEKIKEMKSIEFSSSDFLMEEEN